jgi:hypothetical protein
MKEMRLWLDKCRFQPSRFKYSEDGNDVLIDVGFAIASEAMDFSAGFNGTSMPLALPERAGRVPS